MRRRNFYLGLLLFKTTLRYDTRHLARHGQGLSNDENLMQETGHLVNLLGD